MPAVSSETANVSWSWTRPDDRYLIVHGSRGTVEIGWRSSRYTLGRNTWHMLDGAYDKLAAHRQMHRRWAATLQSNAEPWIDAIGCTQSVAAVEAAYRSLRSGAWEHVDLSEQSALDALSSPCGKPLADVDTRMQLAVQGEYP